jgi:NAD(P)-dependent dehydrogenase (short-subunit alcohol dehydrogenase family)
MEQFSGKIAIVTGGASGIGKSIAEHLVRYGATVIAADLQFKDTESSTDKLEKCYLDVTDAEAVRQLVENVVARHGRLDYIFNNAGFAIGSEVRDMNVEQWQRIIAVNLQGVINGVMAAYPQMIKQQSGHIVNTASLAGLIYQPVINAYSTTKHAVVAHSMGLRLEAQQFGVKVTALCPGYIKTNIYNAAVSNNVANDAFLKLIPFPMLELDPTVEKMLAGVAKNKALVVLPAYGKIVYALHRISPALANLLSKKSLGDWRKVRN